MYNIQTGKRTLVTNQYTLTGNISYANDDYYFMAQKAGVDFIEALNSLCYIRIKSNNKIIEIIIKTGDQGQEGYNQLRYIPYGTPINTRDRPIFNFILFIAVLEI